MQLIPANAEIIRQYTGLRDHDAGPDHFVADSSRVVLKLLESGLDVHSILATVEWYEENTEALGKFPPTTYYEASHNTLKEIVGFNLHQGVMAKARRPADVPLEELLPGPILVMDGIAKTDNVGAIMRNAAAFGVTHILLDHRTCHPFQRRAVRTSMGNVYGMKVHQTNDLPAALRTLKAWGMKIVGFENRPQAIELSACTFASNTVLIIGSEAEGMSQAVVNEVTQLIRIPIDADVYALNAACASAVALYALKNQEMRS